MSAEVAQEFVDAHILVYAFDASARAKQTSARQLLERLWGAGTGCVSVQVLQLATWKVFTPTANGVLAVQRSRAGALI